VRLAVCEWRYIPASLNASHVARTPAYTSPAKILGANFVHRSNNPSEGMFRASADKGVYWATHTGCGAHRQMETGACSPGLSRSEQRTNAARMPLQRLGSWQADLAWADDVSLLSHPCSRRLHGEG